MKWRIELSSLTRDKIQRRHYLHFSIHSLTLTQTAKVLLSTLIRHRSGVNPMFFLYIFYCLVIKYTHKIVLQGWQLYLALWDCHATWCHHRQVQFGIQPTKRLSTMISIFILNECFSFPEVIATTQQGILATINLIPDSLGALTWAIRITWALSTIKNNKQLFSLMSNLQTYYHFKLDFQKEDQQGASGQSTTPNAARTISCKTWNSPVEYPSRECKHAIKESKGNMFNPIFKENVQGQKHPGSCAFAEPELVM